MISATTNHHMAFEYHALAQVWDFLSHPDPPEEFPVTEEPEVAPFAPEADPPGSPEILPQFEPEINPEADPEIPSEEPESFGSSLCPACCRWSIVPSRPLVPAVCEPGRCRVA